MNKYLEAILVVCGGAFLVIVFEPVLSKASEAGASLARKIAKRIDKIPPKEEEGNGNNAAS